MDLVGYFHNCITMHGFTNVTWKKHRLNWRTVLVTCAEGLRQLAVFSSHLNSNQIHTSWYPQSFLSNGTTPGVDKALQYRHKRHPKSVRHHSISVRLEKWCRPTLQEQSLPAANRHCPSRVSEFVVCLLLIWSRLPRVRPARTGNAA
jgi:hypothetical protein